MQTDSTSEQIEAVRREAISVLDDLVERAGEFELAEPPPVLDRYRRKLRQNNYKVLVVGEAKRGKSSFVNALIGRDILPTDVDVATSQVFSIWPSRHEAYRLRFEDGSEKEISEEDLPLYGSQVVADAGLVPTSDRIVRWIEVDVPIRFLPQNVSLLDTPGLGALYAGHAQITHRFVPEADAVIFVLESSQPVIEDDLKFVEEILTVTRNVFFIQTKIDQFAPEEWQDVQHRNEEILAERFKSRLADTRVWPVSSTLLRKAALVEDERFEQAYLMKSRQEELTVALQAFLARVAGWGRAAEATLAAVRFHATGRKALAGRLAGLTEESKQKRAELQKVAVESKRQFDAEWGAQGQKYRELREDLQRAIAVSKQSFQNTLQPGSDIELAQKAKIDQVNSLVDASRVAEEMPGEVITAAVNTWARVCKEVQYRCVELLGPFAEEAEDAGAPLSQRASEFTVSGGSLDDDFKPDYFLMLRGAAGGGMLVAGVAGLLGVTAMTGGLALVAIPALAAAVGGFKGAIGGQVKASRAQLKSRLVEVLMKVRRHFFDVDLMAGNYSLVDEYFRDLDRSVNEQVRKMVEKKSGESQSEIARLTGAVQLDDKEREAGIKETQEQLARWDEAGKSARGVMARIKALERTGAQAAATS